jgi:hypothetical protein
MDGRSGLNMAAGSSMRRVLRKFFIVTIFRKRYVPHQRVGSYQEVGPYRSTFAVISLWGKFGGLHACGDTFPHMVPLPIIFLTLLCSMQRLKRKDFQEIARLPWAQEASGSNPDAPTIFPAHLFDILGVPYSKTVGCGSKRLKLGLAGGLLF